MTPEVRLPLVCRVLFTSLPHYVCSLSPWPCGALSFALAASKFVRRRRHRPFDSHAYRNGDSYRHSEPNSLANTVTYSHADGLSYANDGAASD